MSASNGTDPVASRIRSAIRRKTVVITGATSGIGLATAEALATEGAQITILARSARRADDARAQIVRAGGKAPQIVIADLAEQAEIRAASDELHRSLGAIDVLINNAGSIFAKREMTADGIEKTFAVNHLAPFLLTGLVGDLLASADHARVVMVVSEIYSKKIDFENLQGERRYHFFRAYQASKLANILFANEFARRAAGHGITANSVSPGPAVTRFGDELTGLPALMPKVMKRIPFLFKSPEEAARGVVRLAADPAVADVTGRFFMRLEEDDLRAVASDLENARRLWKVSAELTGLPVDGPFATSDVPAMQSSER